MLVEDYFQVGAFRKHIEPQQWNRFESRLFRNTEATLDLLARHDARATFFILGWNAEQWPELVRRIVEEGHEVASGGYFHDNVRELSREEFCDRMQRAREAIESAAGQPVLGYRMAEGWLTPDDLWLLDHLAEQGYAYDSSLMPRGRVFHRQQWRRVAHLHTNESGRLWEFPPASLRLPFADLPIAGGNYFRQIPHTLMKHVIARWDRTSVDPLMLYFHVWELDVEQPSLSAVDRLTRIRHYRNLGKLNWVLADYLTKYRFGSVAEFLKSTDCELWQQRYELRRRKAEGGRRNETLARASETSSSGHSGFAVPSSALPVSVVVPCYNEEQTVPYLAKTLDGLRAHLAPEYRAEFILVDDGSRDRTWELLDQHFADAADVALINHKTNRGVAQAILTGIGAAETGRRLLHRLRLFVRPASAEGDDPAADCRGRSW